MKALTTMLLALLMSMGAWADVINLTCEYSETLDHDDLTTKETGGSLSVKIDTEKFHAVTKDGVFSYQETGNVIKWTAMYIQKIGQKMAFADKYRLDRVSGALEYDFAYLTLDDGYKLDDYVRVNDIKNYTIGLTHYAQCSKIEALF